MNANPNPDADSELNVNPTPAEAAEGAAESPPLAPRAAAREEARLQEKRLELAPWPRPESREQGRAAPDERYRLLSDPVGLVAALATLGFLAIGGVVMHDHLGQTTAVDSHIEESAKLAQRVDGLKVQIEAVDAARAHETTAEMRKLVGEVKADAAATRDFGAQLQQMSQRIDRLDHDHAARLDKLGDRLDHETASRLSDLAARVDKLEKHSASLVAVAPAAPPSPPPRPSAPNLSANVSNDITGSIGKPKAPLRNYTLEDIHDGMALIESPGGAFTVGPGDVIPGAGRVIRIERRGRDWAVLTDLGVITTPED